MSQPTITSLQPTVLADRRRITVDLVVANLPTLIPNITLTMPADGASDYFSSPYPNLSLVILDNTAHEVAGLFIVEYQEDHVTLTLHLRTEQVVNPLLVRAEMFYGETMIDSLEVFFTIAEE